MSNTANLILPYIDPAQAQKSVTHNASLTSLDAQVQLAVADRTLTAPPGSPVDGERHLVATGATGAWSGWDGNIAAYQSGVWNKYTPREGWLCWVAAESLALIYTSGAWSSAFSPGGGGATWQTIASNTAAVNFSLTGSYRLFTIRYFNASPDVSGALCLQFSTNGGSTWFNSSGDYTWSINDGAGASLANGYSTSDTKIPVFYTFSQSTASGYEASGVIEVYDPLTAGTRKAVTSRAVFGSTATSSLVAAAGGGQLKSSTAACNMCRLAYFDSGGTQHNIAKGIFSIAGS